MLRVGFEPTVFTTWVSSLKPDVFHQFHQRSIKYINIDFLFLLFGQIYYKLNQLFDVH